MTHGSLFSGIGGAELAAMWMGWDNAFHCEINPFCRKVLEYHFPNSVSYDDITTTDFTSWRGRIDILTAGFPCQPFSLAGQRKGAEDDRYLWPQVVRAIREIRPAWVVGENVAGILTMVQPGDEVTVGSEAAMFGEDHRDRTVIRREYVIETVCRDLEREGYSVQPFVIPACAVGAPHRRDRVWIVAHRVDTDPDSPGLQASRPEQQPAGASGSRLQRTTPHPNGERCDIRSDNREERPIHYDPEWRYEENQSERAKRRRGVSENDSTSHAHHAGRMEQHAPAEPKGARFSSRLCDESLPADRWRDFPTTQPVIRAGDDGLSGRLAGITFPKWRAESIKALGNAWVPAVAYEIFRAIYKYEKDQA